MTSRRRWFSILVPVCAIAANIEAQVIAVTPSSLNGWTLTASTGTGNVPPPASYLAPGFRTPPLGAGSLHLAVGQDGNDAAQARHNGYVGTRVDTLTALSYSTYTHVDGAGGQSPYLLFHVDIDGNLTTADVDLWFFEPLYQSAAFFPSNPQGPLTTQTWQMWDALNGGWYSLSGLAGSGPGTNVKSVAQLIAAAPNGTLAASGTGGVRIVTGFGAGAWDNFVGAADNFSIGVSGTTTTYNFEPVSSTLITVTPFAPETWTLTTTGAPSTGSATFVTGPPPPPLGTGSIRLAVGADGNSSAEARSNRFDGSFLREMTELRYSSYQESGGSGGQAPYIILRVDYDNNGTQDDLLFFEPVYQTGAFCPSNPQPAVITGAWQTWNASDGCWWSLNGTADATPGAGVKPLSTILAAEDDARLNTSSAGGAIRIVTGFGAGAWDNFIGYADAFNVSFDPTRTTYDFDPDPIISISDVTLVEGNAGLTNFVFNLTLDKPVSHTVIVQYATADGTATTADSDYTPAAPNSSRAFAPNDTSETITVHVHADLKFEGDETLFVNLSAPFGASISDNQGVGTILNDDPVPTISIDDLTGAEGTGTNPNFPFIVRLSNPSSQTVTITAQTADNTATSSADYGPVPPTLVTFNPGITAVFFFVLVNGDSIFEPDETFFVNLTAPVNASIVDGQGIGTITNDDAQPTISISDVTQVEGNAGTSVFLFTVSLSGQSSQTITVTAQTANDTATAPSDYTVAGPTVLTFPPFITVQSFTVAVNGDAVFEPNETFFVNLTLPTNATISDTQGIGTINNDDAAPVLSINDATQVEGNAGTTNFVFTVTLTGATSQTVTVTAQTADGTATAGADYTVVPATVLTFTPGTTTETVTVVVSGDTAFEPNETFFVNLTAPTNATITDNQGLGTITNDDGPIADVSVAKSGPATTGTGSQVTYMITVTNGGPQAASNVVLTDPVAPPTEFVSSTPSQGTCTGGANVSCTLGSIASGATATITLVVRPMVPGTLTNTAIVSNSPETDVNPANNSGTATTDVSGPSMIPTMSEWMLMLMAAALAAMALMKLRG